MIWTCSGLRLSPITFLLTRRLGRRGTRASRRNGPSVSTNIAGKPLARSLSGNYGVPDFHKASRFRKSRPAAWLVHFRQRDDRPNRMHSYKLGNKFYSVRLKGRAWITSDRFQIVRMEAEMVAPLPEIELLSEHQIVEYGPIPFPKKNTTLWLPKSAEIYFDFRKHRYYRRHSLDHFMLYSVDTEEKRKEPASRK